MPKISDEQRAAARQRLIDATVAVAERDGVDALTTRAIVAEAGVSAGMFYGHFPSKEALLAAVVEDRVEQVTTLVAAEVELGTPLESVMRTLLRELVEVRDLQALAAFRSATRSDENRATQRDINRRIVEAFTPFLEAGVESGLLRSGVDVPAVVEMIDLLVDGINRRRTLDGFVTSDRRVSTVIVDAVETLLIDPNGSN